jgi:predicted CXXCH cytochrome family protein
MANCASCHARREELTSNFTPGDHFHDHFRLALLSQPGVYHEDGQVLDEDFEYGSFLGSRMHHAGISCLDCHDPHSGGLRLPVENNALCLSCHTPPGTRNATPINPLTHSRHPAGSTGAQCVSCHMPETTYMQRDPRRDHGFTLPDPQLTLELGIPNACNRCHEDRDAQWAADQATAWYGEDYNLATRERARVMRRAAEGDATVVPELLTLTAAQEIPMWRASLLALLGPWIAQNEVRDFCVAELGHADPLVRAAAADALAPRPDARAELARLFDDPSRNVRLEAAWSNPSGDGLPPALAAEQELWLTVNSDQPAGVIRRGQQALGRNDFAAAEHWLRRAVAWDPAAYTHRMLGRVLHAGGNLDGAITELTRAVELDPEAPDYPYELALMFAEKGDAAAAITHLQHTVENAPDFGRAWYNLGLAYAGQQKLASALHALGQAEQHLPTSPEPAYAAATIHARMDDLPAALAAAERALVITPNDPGLRGFTQQLRLRLRSSE